MGAFASEQSALRASIRLLGPTLRTANRAFASLNAAFPSTRAFAREILPGVRQTAATIDAGFPWVEQTRRLLAGSELAGWRRTSRPVARLRQARRLLPRPVPAGRPARQCGDRVLLPTGDVPLTDEFATGQPNYREFAYALVGLAGEGQNVDGNGMYVHFQPGGGTNTLAVGDGTGGTQFTNAFPGAATRPKRPTKNPPFVTDQPCYTQARPDLNGPGPQAPHAGARAGSAPTASAAALPAPTAAPQRATTAPACSATR